MSDASLRFGLMTRRSLLAYALGCGPAYAGTLLLLGAGPSASLPAGNFIDDLGVTSWIDDNGVASWTDDLGD
jgi:hypothetical protein